MSTITFSSPYYPGENRIVIDDLRGDALMQRISDLIDGNATAYTIRRTINASSDIGVLVSYSRFQALNTAALTGDKAPAYALEDKTDDFVIPNLNMIFDVIDGNAQQSPASKYRGNIEGSKVVRSSVTEAITGSLSIDVGSPIYNPTLGLTGSVTVMGATGNVITPSGVSGAAGIVFFSSGDTGDTATIDFSKKLYKAIAIRRAASPFSMTGGVGSTGAAANREAVLMSADHYNALLAVLP